MLDRLSKRGDLSTYVEVSFCRVGRKRRGTEKKSRQAFMKKGGTDLQFGGGGGTKTRKPGSNQKSLPRREKGVKKSLTLSATPSKKREPAGTCDCNSKLKGHRKGDGSMSWNRSTCKRGGGLCDRKGG